MKRAFFLRLVLTLAAAGASTAVFAAQPPAPPVAEPSAAASAADGLHRAPPPEAFAACKALKANEACSFTSPKGMEKGRCVQRATSPLACRPEHPGPPPESMAACKDGKLNDACAFTSPEGKETGTCVPHEPGSALGCRPTRK